MIENRSGKKELRAQLRARRQSFPRNEIEEKSRSAAKIVISSDEFHQADIIGLYRACFGEVETDEIFEKARSLGKTTIYPCADRENGLLNFKVVNNLDEMAPGEWRIPEPPANAALVPLNLADLLIIPGVAFDRRGGRLGMGGGFYDRMLASLPEKVVRMGLAYDFQVFDRIPLEEKDQRLHCLVTESGIMRF